MTSLRKSLSCATLIDSDCRISIRQVSCHSKLGRPSPARALLDDTVLQQDEQGMNRT